MSFILTLFGKLVDPLVAVARDVLFKEFFEQFLIMLLPFFFLPAQLPEISWPGARSRSYMHSSHR